MAASTGCCAAPVLSPGGRGRALLLKMSERATFRRVERLGLESYSVLHACRYEMSVVDRDISWTVAKCSSVPETLAWKCFLRSRCVAQSWSQPSTHLSKLAQDSFSIHFFLCLFFLFVFFFIFFIFFCEPLGGS